MSASLNNIRILNKRYSSTEWKSGITIEGATVVPMLYPGEFGFNTTTKEVRANLSVSTATDPITFEAATVVSFPVPQVNDVTSSTGKYLQGIEFDKGESGSSLVFTQGTLPTLTIEKDPSDTTNGAFITGLTVDSTDKHKLLYTTGNHPVSSLTVSAGTNTTASALTDDTVKVMTGATGTNNGHAHTITYTTAEVPTKKYVDNKLNDAKIAVSVVGEGDYVQNVTESTDGHKITVSKATLPTYAGTGTAGTVGNTDNAKATILGQVKITDSTSNGKTTHTLSGTTKTIKGSSTSGGGAITVTENANVITIALDDSVYALKEDCSMAMVFKGTLAQTENINSGVYKTLSTANKAQVGDTYKVTEAGTYGGLACEIGDMVICRQVGSGTSASYQWIRIESGDDVDQFVTAVNAGKGLKVDTNKLSPTLSHEDYSTATDLNGGFTATADGYGVTGKAVTDITFDTDGLGHVKTASLSGELTLATVAGAKQIAQDLESITTIKETGTAITVTDDGAGNDHIYTINHANVSKSAKTGTTQTPTYGGTFNVITSVGTNDQGHVTEVTTTPIQLPASDNTQRQINVTSKTNVQDTSTTETTKVLDSASATPVDFVSGTNIKVTGNSSTGDITISTLGTATASTLGFVKLGTSTSLKGTDAKVYPVGMNQDSTSADYQKLYVSVPWENTDVYGHASNLTDSEWRFAVFKRDRGGHIVSVDDIQVLDANY